MAGDSVDLFAGVLRFLRSVKARFHWVILSLIISLGLGAFYYTTAERKYQSSAKLLILQTGGDSLEKEGNKPQNLIDKMPEFEHLLTSDPTIKETLKNLPDDQRIDLAGVRRDLWLIAFRNNLSVTTMRRTSIMQVSYRSKDPTTAYTVVNELLHAFISEVNRMHQDDKGLDLKLLTRQKETTERDLATKEQELQDLRSQSKVLFGTKDKTINVLTDRVEKTNTAWIEADRFSRQAEALYRAMAETYQTTGDLRQYIGQFNEALASDFLKKQTGIDPAESYATGKTQQDLIAAQSQLEEKRAYLGENHPEIQRLRKEIQVKEQYLLNRNKTISGLFEQSSRDFSPQLLQMARRDYETKYALATQLRTNLDQVSQEAYELGGLFAEIEAKTHEIERLNASYDALVERIKSARLGAENSIRAKITVDPEINRSPVTPRLTMTVFFCLLMGTSFSFALIYILDMVDDRFRSPDDLRREIGAPILAMVRKLPTLAEHGLASLYPFARPNSVESEAFRTLRTAIEFSGEDTRSLTISSTEPGDGKTTVLASLAVAFAQSGKRTLAIDGDMRRPGLTKLFELAGREGLSTILKDSRPIEEVAQRVLVHTDLPNLHLIAAGPKPVNPVELLTSNRLEELLAWADTHYDQILIDAPPSLAVADVQIIGRLVNAAILTVLPDENRRRMVVRAAESLTALGCNLLGIVVNKLQPKTGEEYQYGYGYGYGDRAGYGYGHDDEAPVLGDPTIQPFRKAA